MTRSRLSYFDFRGRAEAIRLFLHATRTAFDDHRVVDAEEWAGLQPTLPFGRLPAFENDGRRLVESHAILRHLGGAGPVGYPGAAEVVNMRPPAHLILDGIHSLPCIGDGRQSGTSGSPSKYEGSTQTRQPRSSSASRGGARLPCAVTRGCIPAIRRISASASGPLPEPISETVRSHDLVVASVLSGNRNFEGRINTDVRANYLASPPLVVAYALAGTVDIDLETDPLGQDPDGNDVEAVHKEAESR